MTLVSEIEGLSSFDYTDTTLSGDAFHEAMTELRQHGWLAQGPFGYIVLDREAGEQFLRTRSASFPGKTIMEIFQVQDGPLKEEMERNILHINGPDHTRLRNLLNPALSPRAVQRHRPALRRLIEGLYEKVLERGLGLDQRISCELVSELAMPYPAEAIAHVMGVPLADAPMLNRWSNMIQRQFDAESMLQRRDEIEAAVAEFYEYAEELLAVRRKAPGDDLISTLLSAEAEGDRLSEVECMNLVLNVLIGGVDTTQSQLSHTLRLLAQHPQQWQLLAERPELASQAIEESLRYEPVTPFTARIVEQELTVNDVTFPVGTIVMVCTFTANRDGEDLDSFDIAAERQRARNLTFGAGVHYCVGANLARAELEEALAFLAPRMQDLRLEGEPGYGTITGIYGLTSLPASFTPVAAPTHQ
ncbi:MAG TPA: cytochrome P450 [Solirubrobacteraceae bacterium]|jgi:cytochrome P450